MPRSRILLSLSVALLAVTLIGAVGWCGGPVEPRQARTDRGPQSQNMGDMASASAGEGGFSATGGVGSGTASGSDGSSPYLNFSDLNIQSSSVYQGRGSLMVPGIDGLRVVGDYTYSNFKGSGTYPTTGNSSTVLLPGNSFDAQLTTNLLNVSVDYLVPGFGSGVFVVGPRLQWALYNEQLRVDNNTAPALSGSGSHSANGVGFGIVGIIDLAKMAGISFVTPKVNFAAQFGGGGGGVRYFNWELSLKVGTTVLGSGPVPVTASAELAFLRYNYKGTVDNNTVVQQSFVNAFGIAGVGPVERSDRPFVQYSVPMVRGVLTF